MTQLRMPGCVIPGCVNPVGAWGDTCNECVVLFGDMLHPTERPALTEEQIVERDTAVRHEYAAMRRLLAS